MKDRFMMKIDKQAFSKEKEKKRLDLLEEIKEVRGPFTTLKRLMYICQKKRVKRKD